MNKKPVTTLSAEKKMKLLVLSQKLKDRIAEHYLNEYHLLGLSLLMFALCFAALLFMQFDERIASFILPLVNLGSVAVIFSGSALIIHHYAKMDEEKYKKNQELLKQDKKIGLKKLRAHPVHGVKQTVITRGASKNGLTHHHETHHKMRKVHHHALAR